MSESNVSGDRRFDLITAGHHFLLRVLPFRQPESGHALATFVAAAHRINASRFDTELVLLRCLAVLSQRMGYRTPSLLDQYLLMPSSSAGDLERFSYCVRRVLRFHLVYNGTVQEAIELLRTRFTSPNCTPASIATQLGYRLSTLAVLFRNHVDCTLTEYIRELRLERANVLLATSNKTIKEVWVDSGYSHHSNFDHDFKRKYNCTPRDYRSHVIRPIAQDLYGNGETVPVTSVETARRTAPNVDARPPRVLIVDDDESTRTTLQVFLSGEGYVADVAASGCDGLTHAERSSPQVVLVDFHLGDIDGLDFLRQLRERPGGDMPNAALFTADWRVFDRVGEVHARNAIVASKLCDLGQVKDLVAYLSAGPCFTDGDGSASQAPAAASRWWLE